MKKSHKIVIAVVGSLVFATLFIPFHRQKHNARDKGIVSYIANSVRELVEYANLNDPPEDDPFKYIQTPPKGLEWLPEGFVTTNNSHFSINVGVPTTIYTSEYMRDNETITFKVTEYSEDNYSTHVEIDGELQEVAINDQIYNYAINDGVCQFIWNIDNCSYLMTGYKIDIEILKNIIKYNFNFGG